MNGDGQQCSKETAPASKTLNPIHHQVGERTRETGQSRSGNSSNNDFLSHDRNRNGGLEKTLCLFCSIPGYNVEYPHVTENVKAMCRVFNVPRREIPRDSSEARLCDNCKNAAVFIATEFWNFEQSIQEPVKYFEEAVRATDILTQEPDAPPASMLFRSKKFKALGYKILESDRNKVIEARSQEIVASGRQHKAATFTQSRQTVMNDAANANQASRMPDEEIIVLPTVLYPEVQIEEATEPAGNADQRSGTSIHDEEENQTNTENLLMNREESEDSLQDMQNPNSCSAVITEIDSTAPIVKQEREPTPSSSTAAMGLTGMSAGANETENVGINRREGVDFSQGVPNPSESPASISQVSEAQTARQKFGEAAAVVGLRKKRKYEFNCRVCKAKFPTKKDLSEHEPSHSKEELDMYSANYVCKRVRKGGNRKIISKIFKAPFINNSSCMDPEKIIPCPVCGKLFKRQCHLGNHMRKHGVSSKTKSTLTATATDNHQMPCLEPMVDDESNEVEILEI